MNDVTDKITEVYHLTGMHEPCSSISHLFGAVLFLFLGLLLLQRGRGNRVRLACLGVYAVSVVLLLSMSAVYHMMARGGTARAVMERLDHAAIFILIAGTFTAAHGLLFDGWLRWGSLLLIWAAAATGITLKTVLFDGMAEWVGLSLYLAAGWLGVFSGVSLGRRYGFAFLQPLVWGGVIYSLGAVLDYFGWIVLIPGIVHPHEVFHICVLLGALFHWRFVWKIAAGERLVPSGAGMPA